MVKNVRDALILLLHRGWRGRVAVWDSGSRNGPAVLCPISFHHFPPPDWWLVHLAFLACRLSSLICLGLLYSNITQIQNNLPSMHENARLLLSLSYWTLPKPPYIAKVASGLAGALGVGFRSLSHAHSSQPFSLDLSFNLRLHLSIKPSISTVHFWQHSMCCFHHLGTTFQLITLWV